jgi:hypothetical protein
MRYKSERERGFEMKDTDLKKMNVAELKALAKKMKIEIVARARKADIVELLASAFRKAEKPTAGKTAGAAKRTAVQKEASGTKRKSAVPAKVKARPAAQKSGALPAKPAVSVPPAGREWKTPPRAEEPIMTQVRVSDAKYYTGPGREQTGASSGLPLGYGEEKIALMARDPYVAYAYWEVTPSRLERDKTWFGWNGKLTVRLYDVTGVQFDGRNASGYYDQEVNDLVGSWYFDVGRPAHSFIADVGLLTPEGRFLTLARSNSITMPRDGVSDVVDEEWMLADEEFWKLYGFSGGPSSLQLQEMVRIRRMQQITSPGQMNRERPKRK